MELPDPRLGLRGLRVAAVGSERVRSGAGALVASDPASLLLAPEEVADPVLRIVLDRARSGSRPLDRSDPHRVCLAIEGGGMRGAVSAGMCVVLEAAVLVPAIDRIYGVSAGALNGWGTVAGQVALGVTHYHDAVSYGVINRMRPLVGRPVIELPCGRSVFLGVIASDCRSAMLAWRRSSTLIGGRRRGFNRRQAAAMRAGETATRWNQRAGH